jgi:hypothetical protein
MNSEKLEPLLSPLWVSIILVIILLVIFMFCQWVAKKYSTKTAAFIFMLLCIPTVGYANLVVGSPVAPSKESVVGGEFNPVADTVEPIGGAIDPQDQEISELLNELDNEVL